MQTLPYIRPDERTQIDTMFKDLHLATPGQVAYGITRLIMQSGIDKDSYKGFTEIVGVLETVKLEIQRRLIAPYEEAKKRMNGDAF